MTYLPSDCMSCIHDRLGPQYPRFMEEEDRIKHLTRVFHNLEERYRKTLIRPRIHGRRQARERLENFIASHPEYDFRTGKRLIPV